MSITTSSAAVSSVGVSADCVGMRSCHHLSRSLRRSISLSSARYRWTITCSSDGHCSAASSATTFIAMDRPRRRNRSEEHTSELQSRGHLVCRLLLEKKKLYLEKI